MEFFREGGGERESMLTVGLCVHPNYLCGGELAPYLRTV